MQPLFASSSWNDAQLVFHHYFWEETWKKLLWAIDHKLILSLFLPGAKKEGDKKLTPPSTQERKEKNVWAPTALNIFSTNSGGEKKREMKMK